MFQEVCGQVRYAKLLEEWNDLLKRRPAFREPLGGYREILAAWNRWPTDGVRPLAWDAERCRATWGRGVPLLTQAPPELEATDIEELVAAGLEFVVAAGRQESDLRQFAEAWDRSELAPTVLLPGRGAVSGLPSEVAGLDRKSVV